MNTRIDNLKIIISNFQEETHSNSVLDFIVWFDAREKLREEQCKIQEEQKAKSRF